MTIIKDKELVKNNDRKLASLIYRSEKHNKRMLSESTLPAYSKHDLMRVDDPFQENHQNPEYTDHMLNKMFLQQLGYEEDRKTGYRSFVKNSLEYIDAGLDFMSGT